MVDAHSYDIKLMISFHSFNSLQAKDVYGSKYGISSFYTDSTAQSLYDSLVKQHVMEHTHKTLGKQWKDLSDYIFAFETQNEAMIGNACRLLSFTFVIGSDGSNAGCVTWICRESRLSKRIRTGNATDSRAKAIKSELGSNSKILVTTGGASGVDESMQLDSFTCESLDVLAIHGYEVGDFDSNKLKPYVEKVKSFRKMLIFQECTDRGSCYFGTSNDVCRHGSPLDANQRNSNIRKWAAAITDSGIPWMYWQVFPNEDPHDGYDYEIGVTADAS